MTKIDWCDDVWNPVWGCRNECPYCYAHGLAKRYGKQVCGRDDFMPVWIEKNFEKGFPRKPSRIFVNSMSDIEHWQCDWIERVQGRIKENPQHQFIFLTQNPIAYCFGIFPANCWLGATATTEKQIVDRQKSLSRYRKHIHILSIEPIQEKIDPSRIDPDDIDWVILGAETGNRKGRVIPPADWIEPFLDLKIPLFMKKNLPAVGRIRREWPSSRR